MLYCSIQRIVALADGEVRGVKLCLFVGAAALCEMQYKEAYESIENKKEMDEKD